MPNILKRPMFRKGGSVSYGTGITSGLEERKNYANGPDIRDIFAEETVSGLPPMPTPRSEAEMLTDIRPGIYDREMYEAYQKDKATPSRGIDEAAIAKGIQEDIAKQIESRGSSVDDMLAGIAATSPDDPTTLQSWGTVLGKAGASAMGLRKQREATIEKFLSESGIQMIKNLTDDQRTALFKNIDALMARDPNLSYADALKMALGQGGKSPYLKTDSPQVAIAKIAENYERDYGPYGSRNIGAFIYGIRQGTISDKIASKLAQGNFFMDEFVLVNGKPGPAFKEKDFVEDSYYFNPYDNTVYHYQGGGIFKPVPME